MTDLTSINSTEFASDASLWTLSNSVCSSCSKTYTTPPNSCGIPQETIFGGPGVLGPNGSSTSGQYFGRYYSPLDSLYAPTALEFDLWVFYDKIPSNPSDTSFYSINGDSGLTTVQSTLSTLISSCQLNYTDSGGISIKAFYKFHVRMYMFHHWINYLDMKFVSQFTVSSTASSFGFRNFQYYLDNSIPYASTILPANFPCSSNVGWNGAACAACHIYCSTCTGSTYNDCPSCKNGYVDYGNGTCLGSCNNPFAAITSNGYPYLCQPKCATTDFFWFYNQSCSLACDYPLTSSVDSNGIKICSNPCYYNDATSTYVGKYLYPDKTCLSACDSPLVKVSSGLCVSPCSNVNNYALQNGSCTNQCLPPLVASTVNGIKYCKSPCSGQYIYLDGSCSASCAAPLIKFDESTDIKYCQAPCTNVNDYVFPNGTCISQCPSLLVSSTVKGNKFCNSPCSGQFIYSNGSCSSGCLAPLEQRIDPDPNIKFCVNPCGLAGWYLFMNGSCQETCPGPLLNRSEPGAKYCFSPCDPEDFLYPNSSCSATCDFPLSVIEEESIAKFCINPCDSDDEFLYPNGSCSQNCSFPLSERIESVAKYCLNPCPTYDDFLYPNGSCIGTCDFPLSEAIESIAKFCFNPCDPENEFLYPNGSCSENCSFPLSERVESVAKYCFSPCSSYSEYLYPFGNCSSECPFPLSNRTEPIAQYCFPLCSSSGMYQYPNGSCLPNCPSPFVKSQQNTENQCETPCSNPQEYFYEAEQVCKPSCVSPYEPSKIDIIKLCSLTTELSPEETKEAQDTVSAVASQGKATGTAMKATSSFSSGNPALALLAGQASMLFYIRYIDVNYTAKLKLVFLLQDGRSFAFTLGLNMPNGLKENIPDRELPGVFEQYKLHSSFLYNYWDTLSSLVLALLLTGALVLIMSGIGRFPRVMRVFQGALSILKWNIPLMIVCGGFGDIYFYASLQIQAGSFDSFLEFLSLLLSVLMIFSGVWILFTTIKIVKDILKPENTQEENENKWQSFELLYGSYERTSLATFAYMALFLSRTIIFNLIVANLYKYPLAQAILINAISFTMFGYLIVKRPLKNLLELVQLFLNEILVIIVNVCVLILAIMDELGIKGQDLRNGVCETIIKIIMIFSSSSLAFVALQTIISIFFFWRLLRRLKAEGKLTPSGIIKSFLNKEGKEKSRIQPQDNQEDDQSNKIVIDSSRPIIHPRIRRMKKVTHSPQKIHTESKIEEIDMSHFSPALKKGEKSFAAFDNSCLESHIISQPNTERTFDVLDLSPGRVSPLKERESPGLISGPRGVYTEDSFSNPNQLTLENNNSGIIRLESSMIQEQEGLKSTISQYRRLKNYLRRAGG